MLRVIPFNSSFYENVANLILKNKEKFSDDYNKLETKEDIIELVEKVKVNLFVGVDNDNFFCFFYAYDFYTSKDNQKVHHCTFNGASVRGVDPSKNLEALDTYIGILYNLYGVIKIKALVAIDDSGKFRKKNKNCLTNIYINPATKILEKARFKREGFLKGDTLKNGNLVDYIIFGRINSKYLKTERKA
jgi:hypothetical protein